jgi:RNA polymerase sigma-70 factor (ECF subfamily)
MEVSDETLVVRAGRGDRAAAAALVLRHADRVVAIASRLLGDRAAAEDVAQETFLKMWTHAREWRPKGAKVSTWLVRIAVNGCFDRLRRRGRERPEDAAGDVIDRAPAADERLMLDEQRRAVRAAIAALPDRQRLAITLCHYEEFSQADAADIVGVSVEALESLLARGRRSLREALADQRNDLFQGESHDQSSIAL